MVDYCIPPEKTVPTQFCILRWWLNSSCKPFLTKDWSGWKRHFTLWMKASYLASMCVRISYFTFWDIAVASFWLTAREVRGRSPGSWRAWRWTRSSCTGHWPCWPACTCWTWCQESPPSAGAPSGNPLFCKDSRERSQESTSSRRQRSQTQ